MKRFPVILTLLLAPLVHAHPDPAHTLAEIDKHLAATPDDPVLLLRKGELLLRGGQSALAMTVVAEGLRKMPSNPGLLLLDARILESQGDKAEAIAKVEIIIRDHPSFPDAWSDLARLRHEAGRIDEAIAAKLRHLECDTHASPGDFLSASSWLNSRGAENDIATAISVLDKGITIYPALTALQQAVIQLECDAGRFDSALERVNGLVIRNKPSVRFSLLRAGIYETAGRHEEAAGACDSALALLDLSSSKPDDNASVREKILLRKQENLDRLAKR